MRSTPPGGPLATARHELAGAPVLLVRRRPPGSGTKTWFESWLPGTLQPPMNTSGPAKLKTSRHAPPLETCSEAASSAQCCEALLASQASTWPGSCRPELSMQAPLPVFLSVGPTADHCWKGFEASQGCRYRPSGGPPDLFTKLQACVGRVASQRAMTAMLSKAEAESVALRGVCTETRRACAPSASWLTASASALASTPSVAASMFGISFPRISGAFMMHCTRVRVRARGLG